jgi:hypothetical protein
LREKKMEKIAIIIYVSLLIISSSFIFNTVSAIPIRTEIHMKQDEANRTLTVVNIIHVSGGGEIVEFKGNASYPLPPLEIGDKITNCTGNITAILSDVNALVGEWEFPGDTNLSITSYSYTLINPNKKPLVLN